jgi:ubiquinone/menaquinone biosynthesis C-methylase UbiE
MSGWAEWLAAHGEADPATVADVERVLEAAALRTGDTVLDVGAGLGLLTLAAHERIGEGWVIAVDPSVGALEELLALAHTANASGIMYLVGDAEVLPLPDASVDVAVLGSALLLVADRAAAVRELARVVRPGGRLSLREPVRGDGGDPATAVDWSPLGALGVRAGALAAELASADPPLLDAGWLEQELEASGFVDIVAAVEGTASHLTAGAFADALEAPEGGEPSSVPQRDSFTPAEVDSIVAHLRSVEGAATVGTTPQLFLSARRA